MRSDANLVDLGADVRSIRCTLTGKMILELERDKERKGAADESLKEKVLGEGVDVRALTQETTLKVKNLDEFTKVKELVMALRSTCTVAIAAVRLRRGRQGHR